MISIGGGGFISIGLKFMVLIKMNKGLKYFCLSTQGNVD